MLKTKYILSIVSFILLVTGCTSTETLQRVYVGEGARLEFESQELNTISIESRAKIEAFVEFYNERLDKWGIPWYGAPVAKVHFKLYEGEKLVGTFGMSDHFITRGFWLSRTASRSDIKDFSASFHKALSENLYPVIPNRKNEELKKAKKNLSLFIEGESLEIIEMKLIKNNVCSLYKSDKKFGNIFININLNTVNSGEYLDTIVKAQLVFNEQNNLVKTRFFGFEVSKKCSNKLSQQDAASGAAA